MSRRPRHRLLALVAGAMLLVGAACGDERESSSPGQRERSLAPSQLVVDAVARTAEARSSRVAFTADVQGTRQAPGGRYTVTGEGAFDYARRQGAFTVTLPRTGGVEIGRVDVVVVGSSVYKKVPSSLSALLRYKPWVKTDVEELERLAGLEAGSLARALTTNPGQALEYLRGAAEMVEVGEERVRGDRVTHYRGTVDLGKAAAGAPPERQAALRKIAEHSGGQPVPFDVWIDGDGRLRKSAHVMDLSRFGRPVKVGDQEYRLDGTLTFTMELFDFGTQVEVAVPPAGQVTDFAQVLGRTRQAR